MTGRATCPPNDPDALTQYRLGMVEKTLEVVGQNLERLATIEQRHVETRDGLARVVELNAKLDDRVRSIELELPTLKLIRGWVIAGVIGCAGLLGVTLYKIATTWPSPYAPQPPAQQTTTSAR